MNKCANCTGCKCDKSEPEQSDKPLTLAEFRSMCRAGELIDGDGTGYYGTATERSQERVEPCEARWPPPKPEYTHVWWFNQ